MVNRFSSYTLMQDEAIASSRAMEEIRYRLSYWTSRYYEHEPFLLAHEKVPAELIIKLRHKEQQQLAAARAAYDKYVALHKKAIFAFLDRLNRRKVSRLFRKSEQARREFMRFA